VISRRDKRKLDSRYVRAVRGQDRATRRRLYLQYLADVYKAGGDLEIFVALAQKPRMNGLKTDLGLLNGDLTVKQAFRRIRERTANLYVENLVQYGLAEIDIESHKYKRITRELALCYLQEFKGVDHTDRTAFCTSAAKTWHQVVRVLHNRYDLPDVRAIQEFRRGDSQAEDDVIQGDNFETSMTDQERADWEAQVA